MKAAHSNDLLNDKRVVEEINKHLWIESQKAGYSIGWQRASDEWLDRYAEGWMKYHLPQQYERFKKKGKGTRKKISAKKAKLKKVQKKF